MRTFSDSRQMSVLLRIGSELDIVGDVSVCVAAPSELLAWCNVLDRPAIRAWHGTDSGQRYVHVTAASEHSPVRGRITAVLHADSNHEQFWKILMDERELAPGEDRELARADLVRSVFMPPDPTVADPVMATPSPPLDATDVAGLVPIEYAADDHPEPCGACLTWTFEHVRDQDGSVVLREWHQSGCSVVQEWEDCLD